MKKQNKSNIKPNTNIPVELNVKKKESIFLSRESVLLFIIVFICYGSSLMNGYALDDFIVLVKNKFVQDGFAGIGNIFSKDTFAGMTDANIMVLAGGRYRPLSLVSFAIEHQLFGNSAFLSHLINVLLYALSGIVLFRLLKQHLVKNDSLAFGIALFFMVLPIHSEPVINIKGRDDIMCLLFFLLSLQQLFVYVRTEKLTSLFFSSTLFFLSQLSKETAITFLPVVALVLYCFTSYSVRKILRTCFPYLIVSVIFILLRYEATKNNNGTISHDLFNNPFVMMSVSQHYATVLLTWLIYLKLIFLPIHLSYDYNYNQIPATDFADWRVLFSIALHLCLIIIAIVYLKRKSLYSFGILFYFITFSILSNLFFNIGAPLAERFMFIPSLGICIVCGKLCHDVYLYLSKSLPPKIILTTGYSLLAILLLLSVYRNVIRCYDWKDNHTLFIADVKSVPNNAKANLNAGLAYLETAQNLKGVQRKQYLDSAKAYYLKAINIYPRYPDGYLNIGVIYSWEENYDSAEIWWNRARKINPLNSNIKLYDKDLAGHYFTIGMKKGMEKNYEESISNLLKAYQYDSLNAEIAYNLGGAYFTINDFDKAKLFFQKTLELNPANEQAKGALMVIERRK